MARRTDTAAMIAALNAEERRLGADLESRVRRQVQVDPFIKRTLVRLKRVRSQRDAL